MRFWKMIIFIILAIQPAAVSAETLYVSVFGDNQGEGTLRTVLHYACDDDGDETITFVKTRLDEIRIFLRSPLVIPEDCNGHVTLKGSDEVETILDASDFDQPGFEPGDLCTLNIYSNGHTVTNYTFSANKNGAGICLFGRDNLIISNRFGTEKSGKEKENGYGVIVYDAFKVRSPSMSGESNIIDSNLIGPSNLNGIWIKADSTRIENNMITESGWDGMVITGNNHNIIKNTITGSGYSGISLKGSQTILTGNRIQANGGCPEPEEALLSQVPGCLPGISSNGAGIFIEEGANNVTIGSKNIIQYNMKGGIAFDSSTDIQSVYITHNQISKNYGPGVGIDLNWDSFTQNDFGDKDSGPNDVFNYPEHFQVFPLIGNERYWGWGAAFSADKAEIYIVSTEDSERGIFFGGGDAWRADAEALNDGFEISPELQAFSSGDLVTTIAFDENNNTSEFSMNIPVGADSDYDGIPNNFETGNGTPASGGSDADTADSDNDGLPDPVEDKNRNGKWEKDLSETSSYNPDSDDDGLSDWAETHGDGRYDKETDSNPLKPDTDGDGLMDGVEDSNGNGIWEGYLYESSPRLTDSDGDGFPDGADTCPSIPNPGQEEYFCL